MPPKLFTRPAALSILLALGVCFAANHVAARVAFDNGVGITTAILMRSGLTALVLLAVVLWQRVGLPRPQAQSPSRPIAHWVLCVGALVALQSLCLYSAVARVPVVLALLVFNTMPLLYALLTWALGGARPSARALMCMGVILLGLAMALDVVARLQGHASSVSTATLWVGVGFGFAAASTMACALWITERRLTNVPGILRSLWTMGLVFAAMLAISTAGAALNTPLLPGGMAWPANTLGWWALAALVVCYGTAFSLWFIWMPRLDMARNGSALNIEPVAVLVMAWMLLGQSLSALQLLGALVVVAGIVLLSRQPKA